MAKLWKIYIDFSLSWFCYCSFPSGQEFGCQHFFFEAHVNNITQSAYYHINRLRPSLSANNTAVLLHALVRSHIDYCNSHPSGDSQNLLYKLQMVQIVTRTPLIEHITPVLKQLHWLPVTYRIQVKILLFTYKALHNQVYSPTRSLRSSSNSSYTIFDHHVELLVVLLRVFGLP